MHAITSVGGGSKLHSMALRRNPTRPTQESDRPESCRRVVVRRASEQYGQRTVARGFGQANGTPNDELSTRWKSSTCRGVFRTWRGVKWVVKQ